MAEVGKLTWIAEIQKIAESKREAEEMSQGLEGVSEQARQADEQFGSMAESTDEVNRGWGKLSRQGASLAGTLGMLTSGAILLLSKLGKLDGVSLGGLLGGAGGGGLAASLFGGLTGSAISKYLPSIGIGSLLSGIGVRGLLKLLPIIGIGAILGGLVGGELGKLLGHESIGKVLGAITGAALAAKFGTVALGKLLTALGTAGGSLSALLGTVGLGTIVAGVGSVGALIVGVASLTDLVDGDISGWNLPAKFGKALGEAFQDHFPDLGDKIREGMTNNPAYDAGEAVRKEGWVGATVNAGEDFVAGTKAFLNPNRKWKGFSTGGMVEETGPALVHENEAVLPADLVASLRGGSGGGGGGTTIEEMNFEIGDQSMDLSRLDRRQLETLADLIAEKQGSELETLIG